jgi:hypothetical protein
MLLLASSPPSLLTYPMTRYLSLSLSLSLSHKPHTHAYSHTHTRTHTRTNTHAHTHTHTHTLSLSLLSLSLSLSLTHTQRPLCKEMASSAQKDAPVVGEGRKLSLQTLLATQLSCHFDRAEVCPVQVIFLPPPPFFVCPVQVLLGLGGSGFRVQGF